VKRRWQGAERPSITISNVVPPGAPTDRQVGVVGLWHLGCTITAAWLRLGLKVAAFDPEGRVSRDVGQGRLPVAEPGLLEVFNEGLRSGALVFASEPRQLSACSAVFIAHDTIIREDDSSDLAEIWRALEFVAKSVEPGTTVIVSSQLPVGTARAMRARLLELNGDAELVYVPENLRLGEALERYLHPDYVVIGAATSAGAEAAERLFTQIPARYLRVRLESAELIKHAINSFLATSVSLANHWADVATAVSADYGEVEAALRADVRIGRHAYIGAGLGFSGGTLGRDLTVLAEISEKQLRGAAPLFEEVLKYNAERASRLVRDLVRFFDGGGARIAVLGLTYKAGTSTLRRSRPVEIARALTSAGMIVAAHDPQAERSEVAQSGLDLVGDVYAAAHSADLALLLTGWPEYRDLDLRRLGLAMSHRRLLDPAGFLRARAQDLAAEGFSVGWSMNVPEQWRT
jgi:UDPglucose 6-dehydrogenase